MHLLLDLPPGDYVPQRLKMCAHLCHQGESCCDVHATCRCGTHTGKYECVCQAGYYGSGLRRACRGKQDARPTGP